MKTLKSSPNNQHHLATVDLSELTTEELNFEFDCLSKEKRILSRQILDIETEMIGLREELLKRHEKALAADRSR